MTTRDTAAEPRTERVPVRIKVYGGGRLLSPGTDWRVERITEHVAPSGLIGEVMPEWTLIDLSPLAIGAEAASGPALTAEALAEADEAASVAHDYIWPQEKGAVTKEAASDAIWTIHGILRPAIEVARLAPAAAEPADSYSGLIAVARNAKEQGYPIHVATRTTCAEHIEQGDDKREDFAFGQPAEPVDEAVWAHVVMHSESMEPDLLDDETAKAVNGAMHDLTAGHFIDRAWIRPGPLLAAHPTSTEEER